jgi:hypothetical protein
MYGWGDTQAAIRARGNIRVKKQSRWIRGQRYAAAISRMAFQSSRLEIFDVFEINKMIS